MIDLHCHMLPGVDDGAANLDASLEMARMAAADGTMVVVCTPHILPTVYDNKGPEIRVGVHELQIEIDHAAIPLHVLPGADVHIAPDLPQGLRCGRVLSIADTRYLLFEPPHHVMPPRMQETVFALMAAGYVPILTHPERLTWIEQHYDVISELANAGMPMQITAGALTGRFGRRPKHWCERMLEEGIVDVIASDAHDPKGRPPGLSEARDIVAERIGEQMAWDMVLNRPLAILENRDPSEVVMRTPRRDYPMPRHGFLSRTLERLRKH